MKIALHRLLLIPLALTISTSIAQEKAPDSPISILVVVSPEGTDEYLAKFRVAVATWQAAAESVGAKFDAIGMNSDSSDIREQLKTRLLEGSKASGEDAGPFWLVLIGHGTFDGRIAKFNVKGPDFTDLDLAEWLKDFDRPLAVINTASASGSFIKSLTGEGRVIITATKSAFEVFYARFGEYFAKAIAGQEEADVDNDDQVSLLEAYLYSADQVAQFYEMEGRLATEHALLDDTGDGIGTRPEWFEGIRATRVAKEGAKPDGELAHQMVLVPNAIERRLSPEQRQRRSELEGALRDLVKKRAEIGDEVYYNEIEPLLLEIGRIYESVGLSEDSEEEKVEEASDGKSS